MNALRTAAGNWLRDVAAAWDQFWFTASPPHTLALLRILGGLMMFYTHLVWTLDLDAFLGPTSWVSPYASRLMGSEYGLSLFWLIDDPTLYWPLHLAGLAVFALLVVGWKTRLMSILACVLTLSYCHRLTAASFGLDQVNALLALYLLVGRAGDVWSLDHWLAQRRAGRALPPAPSVGTNVALRLIQLHMCVIYLFGGITKLKGDMWWDGSALWFAFTSLEYQSLDMTWAWRCQWMIALLTHATIFWETFYIPLVYWRLTRPLCLAMAVLVHGGIALCLGMKTFGLAMIIGNLAFLAPELVQAVVAATVLRPLGRLFGGGPATRDNAGGWSGRRQSPLPAGTSQ